MAAPVCSTTFYIEGQETDQWEEALPTFQIGQGLIWHDEEAHRVRDVWTSFDKHRHDFGMGVRVLLEPTEDYPNKEDRRQAGEVPPRSGSSSGVRLLRRALFSRPSSTKWLKVPPAGFVAHLCRRDLHFRDENW